MGRSVSTPSNAVVVAYTEWDCEESYEFNDNIDWFVETCQGMYPSLEEVDTWIGREDRVVLENAHAQIGVSAYFSVVALWVVPQEDDWYPEHNSLHTHWCEQIEEKFKATFGTLIRTGTFSTGNAVYKRK